MMRMWNKKSAVKVVLAVFAGMGLGLCALADGVKVDSLLHGSAVSCKPVDFAGEIRNGRTEVFRQAPFKWHVTPRHDYSKTFVTKLFMAQAEFEPELMGKYKLRDNGKVTTYLTCEQALEVIKGMDAITLGMPKIVYLVGWQYNGHDSKYPAFFEGNPAIKRACDRDALESLRWLMREARKYHTAVSLHVNMFDAYIDSPLYEEYQRADVFAKDKDGKVIESEWGAGCASNETDAV